MFSSVDCLWLSKEPVVQCVGSDKGTLLFDVQSQKHYKMDRVMLIME